MRKEIKVYVLVIEHNFTDGWVAVLIAIGMLHM